MKHLLVRILCQLREVAYLRGDNLNTVLFFPTTKSKSLVLLDHCNSTILVLWHHVTEIVLTILSRLKREMVQFQRLSETHFLYACCGVEPRSLCKVERGTEVLRSTSGFLIFLTARGLSS
jgi:hypothetical protein